MVYTSEPKSWSSKSKKEKCYRSLGNHNPGSLTKCSWDQPQAEVSRLWKVMSPGYCLTQDEYVHIDECSESAKSSLSLRDLVDRRTVLSTEES